MALHGHLACCCCVVACSNRAAALQKRIAIGAHVHDALSRSAWPARLEAALARPLTCKRRCSTTWRCCSRGSASRPPRAVCWANFTSACSGPATCYPACESAQRIFSALCSALLVAAALMPAMTASSVIMPRCQLLMQSSAVSRHRSGTFERSAQLWAYCALLQGCSRHLYCQSLL